MKPPWQTSHCAFQMSLIVKTFNHQDLGCFKLDQMFKLAQVMSLSRPVSRQKLSDFRKRGPQTFPTKTLVFYTFSRGVIGQTNTFLVMKISGECSLSRKIWVIAQQQTKRCPLSQHSFSRPGSLSRIFHRHLLKGCQDSFVFVLYAYTLYSQHKSLAIICHSLEFQGPPDYFVFVFILCTYTQDEPFSIIFHNDLFNVSQ